VVDMGEREGRRISTGEHLILANSTRVTISSISSGDLRPIIVSGSQMFLLFFFRFIEHMESKTTVLYYC